MMYSVSINTNVNVVIITIKMSLMSHLTDWLIGNVIGADKQAPTAAMCGNNKVDLHLLCET